MNIYHITKWREFPLLPYLKRSYVYSRGKQNVDYEVSLDVIEAAVAALEKYRHYKE
jgi:hypothetical protein